MQIIASQERKLHKKAGKNNWTSKNNPRAWRVKFSFVDYTNSPLLQRARGQSTAEDTQMALANNLSLA